MLLHLWHPTAWRFGRCKFCSGDPGRASTACLIKSKVLIRDIYTARHQAHGWAVWAQLYKLLENFVEFRTEPRQLFARAAERATSAPSVRPVPLGPGRNAHRGLAGVGLLEEVSCTVVGWLLQGAGCPVPGKLTAKVILPVQKCSSPGDWFRGVDAPQRQVKLVRRSSLAHLPSGSRVPKAGVTGRLVSQLLNHRSPQPSLLWETAIDLGSGC